MENVFDVAAWITRSGWAGEAATQARDGFNEGWQWAANDDLGLPNVPEEDAYSAGEGHYANGFDMGKEVYQSGEYDGGVANY